ncbi:hemin uptake protein HemP [Paraburkholderia jirisanensis]
MTNLTRPSTLSLRRPATQALTTSRSSSSSKPPRASSTAPVAERDSAVDGSEASGERMIRSDTLLQGRTHISIMHNGETYQLRATRLGKLILTK